MRVYMHAPTYNNIHTYMHVIIVKYILSMYNEYVYSFYQFLCTALIHAVTMVLSVHAQMSFVTLKCLLVLVAIVVIFLTNYFYLLLVWRNITFLKL